MSGILQGPYNIDVAFFSGRIDDLYFTDIRANKIMKKKRSSNYDIHSFYSWVNRVARILFVVLGSLRYSKFHVFLGISNYVYKNPS